MGWESEAHSLNVVLKNWNPENLVVVEQERDDHMKVITYWHDNCVIAQCLTRPDNRIVKMLSPVLRLN